MNIREVPRSCFRQRRQPVSARRGAIVALVAVFLPIILMMAAFAVNLAYMELVRSELRTSTDAAARAASRTLSLTQDSVAAVAEARDAASRNSVGGVPLLLDDTDIEFGTATRPTDSGRFTFSPEGARHNSVRIVGRLTADSPTGEVHMPFAAVFARSHFDATKQAVATHVDRDIVLILDRSGSMAFAVDEAVSGTPSSAPEDWEWGDAAPPDSRWRDLTSAAEAFLQKLELTPMDEKVAVATFSTTSTVDQDLTFDYSLVSAAIDTHTQNFTGGATSISEGMVQGIQSLTESGLARNWAAKTMVILTDGIHNSGVDPADIISQAQQNDITVHTVTYGDGADQTSMQQIATECNGKHWHAPTGSELIQAYADIVDNCPTLLTE